MNLVIRYIVWLLTGAVLGAAILSAAPPKAQSTSYRLVDVPKIQRLATLCLQRGLNPDLSGQRCATRSSQPKQRSAKPKPRSGQLLRVGIIDTGYSRDFDNVGIPLCDRGHFNFGNGTPSVGMGTIPHGMAVAQAIMETSGDSNICFVFYQVEGILGITSENVDGALKMARTAGLVAVNMSLTGPGYFFSEKKLIEDLGRVGVSVFIAAGNEHKNLDTACTTYPGCYKISNAYMVGALDSDTDLVASYSNFGTKVDVWKSGEVIFNGQRYRGTSFAAPRALGDYVNSLNEALSGK